MVLDGVRRVNFFLLGFGGLIYFSLVLAYFLPIFLFSTIIIGRIMVVLFLCTGLYYVLEYGVGLGSLDI